MAAAKFTQAQREQNMTVIEQMYFSGHPQVEIAARIGVRPQTLTYYLDKLNAIWQEKHAEKLDAHKARELARLDHVEREYWRAWERSQADTETATQEQMDGKTRASLTKRSQFGDARFLEGILRCIETRLRIVGGFAPTKFAPTDPTGMNEYTGRSDSELVSEFARLVDASRARASGTDTGGTESEKEETDKLSEPLDVGAA